MQIWERLVSIRELQFEAHSSTNSGWTGIGRGAVRTERCDQGTLLFHESGHWRAVDGREIAFHNVFRWTAVPDGPRLRLEHLRFGASHPVHLFDLISTSERTWESFHPHLCREDCYTARMIWEDEAIQLDWKILGPTKDERISYLYK